MLVIVDVLWLLVRSTGATMVSEKDGGAMKQGMKSVLDMNGLVSHLPIFMHVELWLGIM